MRVNAIDPAVLAFEKEEARREKTTQEGRGREGEGALIAVSGSSRRLRKPWTRPNGPMRRGRRRSRPSAKPSTRDRARKKPAGSARKSGSRMRCGELEMTG